MNILREKLKSGKPLFGTQAFLGSKEVMEILGAMNYDFVFICAEHPAYGIERLYDLVKYCEAAGTPALVRLPEFDGTFVKKTVDMGVSGVLFPMIRSAEEAKRATDACLYPPRGTRGFGPMSAVRWGLDSESGFVKGNVDGTVRMIQIEHIDAVKNLEKIAANEYIDAYIFGPNDLAASMGHINDMYHPEVQNRIKEAVHILSRAGKRFGVSLASVEREQIAYWKGLGMNIFSLGADFAFVRDGANRAYESLRGIVEGEKNISV